MFYFIKIKDNFHTMICIICSFIYLNLVGDILF